MRVHINETRCKHTPCSVDSFAGIKLQIGGHIDDTTIADRNIAAKPRTSGAVDDPRVLNQQIDDGLSRMQVRDYERRDDQNKSSTCIVLQSFLECLA